MKRILSYSLLFVVIISIMGCACCGRNCAYIQDFKIGEKINKPETLQRLKLVEVTPTIKKYRCVRCEGYGSYLSITTDENDIVLSVWSD